MPQYELNIRDYLRIIRRRRWTIIFSFVLVLLLTIFYTNQQTPVYQTSTMVKIEQRTTFTGLLAEYFSYNPGDVIATEQNIITSYKVLEELSRRMGLINENSSYQEIEKEVNALVGMVSTQRVETSNAIRIKVTSDNPAKAAAVANTLAKVYADISFEERNKETAEARRFIEDQLILVESKLQNAEENLRRFQESGKASGSEILLRDKLSNLKLQLSTFLDKYTEKHPLVIKLREQIQDMEEKLKDLPSEEIELSRLKREVSMNEGSYDLLNKKYKEALITESQKFEPVIILNPAPEPTSPIKPNKPLNMIVGTVVGLMLGFVFASVRENLDTSIGTIEEVEEYLRIPVLGLIPHIYVDKKRFKGLNPHEEKTARLQANLVLQYDPKSVFAEAYRALQTNIKIVRIKEGEKKVILITSATINEGKTITAANYAVATAQTGARVLLIDMDLRKPILHRIFGVQREPGITDVLIGNAKLEESTKGVSDFLVGGLDVDSLLRIPGIENLKLLPAGFMPPNPTTLLNSEGLRELLQRFKNEFDLIVLDCPPVLPVADAIILGDMVDAVLLVYQVGRVARGALRRASTQLTNANVSILGVVLNKITAAEMEMGHAYYYYYYKSYKEESKNWWDNFKGWITGKRA